MAAPKLKYVIVPPTDVIEASTSTEPDDVSRAHVKIEVSNTSSAPVALDRIRFVVAVTTVGEESRRAALTTNPKSITPVARDFGRWTFTRPEEGGVFVAQPISGQIDAGEITTFLLHDIEVVDQVGKTPISVTEIYPEDTTSDRPVDPPLALRKVDPALRIDYFSATERYIQSGETTTLDWATTAATKVELEELTAADAQINSQGPFDPLSTANRDAQYRVRPQTTTTYTLKASRGSEAFAVRQLTVTVQNQTVVENLEVQGQVNGDLKIESQVRSASAQVTGQVRAGSANITGTLTAGTATIHGNLTVGNQLSAGTVVGVGAMVRGMIVMWSGLENNIPEGWKLCNGNNGTPDLRGRFIVGQGRGNFGTSPTGESFSYPNKSTGGTKEVTLTEGQMPRHDHSVTGSSTGYSYNRILTLDRDKDGEKWDGGGSDNNKRPNLRWSASMAKKGNDRPHENRPPYYALCFIMKT